MTTARIPGKALLITFHDPLSTTYGAGQRTHFLLKALGTCMRTDVLQIVEAAVAPSVSTLPENLGSGTLYRLHFVPNGLFDAPWLSVRSARLDHLVQGVVDLPAYSLLVCRYIAPLMKLHLPPHTPVLIDFDDPVYRPSLSGIKRPSTALKETVKVLHQLLISVRLRLSRAQNREFLFVCDRDQQEFSYLRSSVLPNIPSFPRLPPSPPTTGLQTLLFVGMMSWQPNIDGVEHFLKHIWPLILTRVPTAQLSIVGKATSVQLNRLNTFPNCQARGFVKDLDQAYADAAICIVPLYSGGGSNIKLPEACAHMRPVVATRYSYSGWDSIFSPDEHLLVADDDLSFAAHCCSLLENVESANTLVTTGHRR
ncbi:MAG: hypothetical protein RLZZ126_1, partial [Pseudomonadota bacterium]